MDAAKPAASGNKKWADVDDSEKLVQQQKQLAAVEPQAALPNQRAVWASVDKLMGILR